MADNINYKVVSATYTTFPSSNACDVQKDDKQLYKFNGVPVQPRKPTQKTTTTKTVKPKRTTYQYQFQKARTDKRVSLNVAPLQFDRSGNFNPSKEPFAQRIAYVLGSKTKVLPKGQTVYGFLNSCLSKSCGLIFPYTPTVSISHQVNYDRTDVTHSNVSFSHYKNTPPPTYSIDAVFTADTRENALHMLSAIWFLRAVTKCNFGEYANEDGNIAGMPPPVLYLNGYNQIMDNIPVIVKSFSYSLPNDKDYVALGVNLDTSAMIFNNTNQPEENNSNALTYLNGIANAVKNLQNDATTISSNRYNDYYFNNWLPTEMTFRIELEVQPNLLKYKKQFNLNDYKMGIYNLDSYKGGSKVYIPTSNGIQDCTNNPMEQALVVQMDRVTNGIDYILGAAETLGSLGTSTSIFDKIIKDKDMNENGVVLSGKDLEKLESGMNLSSKQTSYKFDRSGFTW